MSQSSIPVLVCADAAYFQHMAVTIASLLANNRAHRFALTIVTDRDYPDLQARLSGMVEGFGNASVSYVEFHKRRLGDLPTLLHYTPLIYVRLFATEIFPPEIDKVLYLDSDLVVCADIADLWAAPMGEAAIAGVPDIFIDSERGLPPGQYVNSGVLLLNLARWRFDDAAAKLFDYIGAHADPRYPDQDALNAVFAGSIHVLPLRWNFQARMALAGARALGISRAEFRALRRHPGIVHYTTGSKPWMYRKTIPYKHLYQAALAMTPWKDYRPPDATLRRRVSRRARMMGLRQKIRYWLAGL